MRKVNDELSLERLLLAAKNLTPTEEVNVHYDPLPHFFYISSTDMLSFFLPKDVYPIYQGMAKDVPYGIETFISNALRRLEMGDHA